MCHPLENQLRKSQKFVLTKGFTLTYYTTAKRDSEIRYVKVYALLADLPGVEDFRDLTMNGVRENLTIQVDEYPATVNIVLEE